MAIEIPEDRPARVEIEHDRTLHDGFRKLAELSFRLPESRTRVNEPYSATREILRVAPVAAILPYDPEHDSLVLIRQFRIAAHEATGLGDMVEVVAGYVEDNEDPIEAARRELREETGLDALDVIPMLRFVPTPGVSTEQGYLWCARVRIGPLEDVMGAEEENELIRPLAVPADAAIKALDGAGLHNGYALLALSCFARHRDELRRRWLAQDKFGIE